MDHDSLARWNCRPDRTCTSAWSTGRPPTDVTTDHDPVYRRVQVYAGTCGNRLPAGRNQLDGLCPHHPVPSRPGGESELIHPLPAALDYNPRRHAQLLRSSAHCRACLGTCSSALCAAHFWRIQRLKRVPRKRRPGVHEENALGVMWNAAVVSSCVAMISRASSGLFPCTRLRTGSGARCGRPACPWSRACRKPHPSLCARAKRSRPAPGIRTVLAPFPTTFDPHSTVRGNPAPPEAPSQAQHAAGKFRNLFILKGAPDRLLTKCLARDMPQKNKGSLEYGKRQSCAALRRSLRRNACTRMGSTDRGIAAADARPSRTSCSIRTAQRR